MQFKFRYQVITVLLFFTLVAGELLGQMAVFYSAAKAESVNIVAVGSESAPHDSAPSPLAGTGAIAAGDDNSCVFAADGGVRCWGDGVSTPSPMTVLDDEIIAADFGDDFACVLTAVGGVTCWGMNDYGQLGNGKGGVDESGYHPEDPEPPQDVIGISTSPTLIAAGSAHTCALIGGGVRCWGLNLSGQLGDGNGPYAGSLSYGARCSSTATYYCQLAPVDVIGLGSGVVDLAAGSSHTCAVTAAGGVKCWGMNDRGQLGTGGNGIKCARDGEDVDADVCQGSEQCGRWGYESCHAEPVDVLGLGSGVQSIVAGYSHSCALMMDGAVKCWGANGSGQLGDGTQVDRLTPVGVSGLGQGVKALVAGSGFTCALTTGGGVKCWGGNSGGQLGDGTFVDRLTPVTVVGMESGVTEIAAGSSHVVALTANGAVKCWGGNDSGQLGDGSTSNRNVPVEVIARPQLIVGELYLPMAVRAPEVPEEDMVFVPAGEFQMGCDAATVGIMGCPASETPLHEVYLDAYLIDKYEVTNAEYRACIASGKCHDLGEYGQDDTWSEGEDREAYYHDARWSDFPVLGVTYNEARTYCEAVGKRIPTEAEWEKAARGSTDTRRFPWGNEWFNCTLANLRVGPGEYCTPGGSDAVGDHPTGASPYGVMDMSGNALEWVSDYYSRDYYSVSPRNNPKGPASGEGRVLRGSSYYTDPIYLYGMVFERISFGNHSDDDESNNGDVGFRCAKSQ